MPPKTRYKYGYKSKSMTAPTEDEEEEEEKVDNEIKITNNNIYLYGEINKRMALDFNVKFDELVKKYQVIGIQTGIENPVINIHINSCGGDVIAALSIIETVRKSKLDIHTFIEGECSSAATLIAVIGKKRYIGKYSIMLIHQLRSGFWGTVSEFEEENKNNKTFMKIIKTIYYEHTGIDAETLEKMLLKDRYMKAKKTIQLGIMDEII